VDLQVNAGQGTKCVGIGKEMLLWPGVIWAR